MSYERAILLDVPDSFVGERIVVRCFRVEDAPAVFAVIQESVDHIRPWLPWYHFHQSLDDTLEYIRRTQASYLLREDFGMGVFHREDGRFLGSAGIHSNNQNVP